MFFALLCIFVSVATQGWLLYEVGGTARVACEFVGTEALVALVSSSTLVLVGYCCRGLPGKTFFSAGVSAVVLLLLARLTVEIPESHKLCASADYPADDIVASADTRDRANLAAWLSLAFLAVGLLLLHCGKGVGASLCSCLDCFGCADDSSSGDDFPRRRVARRRYGFVDTESCEGDDDEDGAPRRPARARVWVVAR